MTDDPNALTPEELATFPEWENADFAQITEQVRRDEEAAAQEVHPYLTRDQANVIIRALDSYMLRGMEPDLAQEARAIITTEMREKGMVD